MEKRFIYTWYPCASEGKTHLFAFAPGGKPTAIPCPACGQPLGTVLTDDAPPRLIGTADVMIRSSATYDYLVLPGPLYKLVSDLKK